MSMMMPPEAPPGLPIPPGGADTPPPPMDGLSGQPMPAEGGLEGLIAALQGGGMPPGLGGGEGAGPPPDLGGEMMGEEGGVLESEGEDEELDSVGHIQQAMKHLMMAMAMDEDDERGQGITKGMGALQGILAGEQKKTNQLSALGG